MIADANLALSGSILGNATTGQAVTGTNVTVLSTNTIDLLANRDIAEGQGLFARMQVLAAFVGATSVEMQVITSAAAALTTPNVIGTTGAIPLASLVAGSRFAAALTPKLASVGQRYLGVQYVIIGAGTAGTVYTDIGLEIQDGQKMYPSGYAVL